MLIFSCIISILGIAQLAIAEPNMDELEGTWSSKSNTVFTGPGFYDPVDELLIEPDLPGISYSFTADGHFEQALYRVTSNAINHECPTAVLQFQHGTYEILSNGSLVLTPIAVDGRQLLSDPCGLDGQQTNSVYSRYVQDTWFKTFQVSIDPYHGRYKLQLFQFDGSPVQPLYLAYKPPMMLPTYALNPTDTAAETAGTLPQRIRRSLENKYRTTAVQQVDTSHFDRLWYICVTALAGSAVVLFFH